MARRGTSSPGDGQLSFFNLAGHHLADDIGNDLGGHLDEQPDHDLAPFSKTKTSRC